MVHHPAIAPSFVGRDVVLPLLLCGGCSKASAEQGDAIRLVVEQTKLLIGHFEEDDVIGELDDMRHPPVGNGRSQGKKLSFFLPVPRVKSISIR